MLFKHISDSMEYALLKNFKDFNFNIDQEYYNWKNMMNSRKKNVYFKNANFKSLTDENDLPLN